jgi:hypothetical protein
MDNVKINDNQIDNLNNFNEHEYYIDALVSMGLTNDEAEIFMEDMEYLDDIDY